MKRLSVLCLLAWLAATSLNCLASTPVLNQASDARVRPAAQVAGTPASHGDELTLSIDTPLGSLDVRLQPARQMRAQAARWVPAIRDGETQVYRGHVAGYPGSWVRMTRIDGAWLGAIQIGATLWLLDPARDHPAIAARMRSSANDTLIFTLDDFQGLETMDFGGVAPPLDFRVPPATPAHTGATSRTTATHYLGVTLVLDTEFLSHYGSSSASTAIGILNIIDGFYSTQANTEVYVRALKSLASNDTLTSTDPATLLNAFASYSQSSLPFSGIAHLLSGKDFDGSTIGLAWIGGPNYTNTLCNSKYGTGINQITFSAAAGAASLAHEMGHNYGALHDGVGANTDAGLSGNSCSSSGYIMNAITNTGHPPTQFSTCSLAYFSQYLGNKTPQCLAARPDAIFENGFD